MSEQIAVDKGDLEALLDVAEQHLVQIDREWGGGWSFQRLAEEGDEDALLIQRLRASMHEGTSGDGK